MRRHITRVMYERSARQQDADLKPVGGWDKAGCRRLGGRRVEQPGDVSMGRNNPPRSARNTSCTPDAQKAVADREPRLEAVLAKRIVAMLVKDPCWICGRLQGSVH